MKGKACEQHIIVIRKRASERQTAKNLSRMYIVACERMILPAKRRVYETQVISGITWEGFA